MFNEHNQKKLVQSIGLIAVAASLLMLVQSIGALKEFRYIGRGQVIPPTISVSGDGKALAVPDIATITASIHKEAKTSEDAKKQVDDIAKSLKDAVIKTGVAEADIKTTGYNVNPKYEWQQGVCPERSMIPCPPGKNVQVGFEVTQSFEFRVHKIDNASKVLDVVTAIGATDISGPNFTVDEPSKVQAEAREKAIADAKTKAEKLADQLGVHLIRIASFNENGTGAYPTPRAMYMKAEAMDVAGSASTLPVGQNEYNSSVSITYEIQ